MTCVVYGCSNNDFATADPSIPYYVFPKHPLIAQQWVEASGWQADQVDVNLARICSIHFDDSSYTTEIKVIDYITCYTKVLKFDAVPTLYLPQTTEIVIKQSESHQVELREMIVFTVPTAESVETPPHPDTSKEYLELQVQPVALSVDGSQSAVAEKYRTITTKEQLSALEGRNRAITEKIAKLENDVKALKGALAKQMEVYRAKDMELSSLHNDYCYMKRSFLSLHDQKALLGKVFSESQIKILSGKKKIYWSNDDMAVGYTIRHLSNKRCYLYLTKKLNIPLPAVSSIKRWMTLKNAVDKKSVMVSKKSGDEDTE